MKYLPLLLLALAWEAVVQLGLVSRDVLPSLSDVLKAGWTLLREGDLWKNGLSSAYRGAAGLAFAIVVGGLLGIAMAWWRPVDAFLGPLVEALYPLPKSALIPVTGGETRLVGAAPARVPRKHAPGTPRDPARAVLRPLCEELAGLGLARMPRPRKRGPGD